MSKRCSCCCCCKSTLLTLLFQQNKLPTIMRNPYTHSPHRCHLRRGWLPAAERQVVHEVRVQSFSPRDLQGDVVCGIGEGEV